MERPECLRDSEFHINKNIETDEFSQEDIYQMWQYIIYLETLAGKN